MSSSTKYFSSSDKPTVSDHKKNAELSSAAKNLLKLKKQKRFNEFLNHRTFKRSTDTGKLHALENALGNCDWDAEIFTDKDLVELILTLFESEIITDHQVVTLFERIHNLNDFKPIQTIAILDEKDHFTKDAKELLLPQLDRTAVEKLTPTQIERLRIAISQLPKSEQVFNLLNGSRYKEEIATENDEYSLGAKLIMTALENPAIITNASPEHLGDQLINLSSGVREAFGKIRFGQHNYVQRVPILGEIKYEKIEYGIQNGVLYGTIQLPETKTSLKLDDSLSHVTHFEQTAEEIARSMQLSTFPPEIRLAFLHLKELLSNVTEIDEATEFDKLTFCEFPYFQFEEIESLDKSSHDESTHKKIKKILELRERIRKTHLKPDELTFLFFDILLYTRNMPQMGYLLDEDSNLTTIGTIFLLDLVKNSNKWKEFGIDVELAIKQHLFPNTLKKFQQLYKEMKDDSQNIQLLKIHLYRYFEQRHVAHDFYALKQFTVISQLISQYHAAIETNLFFHKGAKSIYLKFGDIHISDDPKNNTQLLDEILTVIAKEKGLVEDASIKEFKNAILKRNYDPFEIDRYFKAKKSGLDDVQARHLAQPSLLGWIALQWHKPEKQNPIDDPKAKLSAGSLESRSKSKIT